MKSKQFLKKYLNGYSPVAQETEGQKIWMDYVSEFSNDISIDPYGTAYASYLSKEKNPYKVVIEAHCDEIAWMITHIEESGMIRVKRNGGSDNMIAPSKTVYIHTLSGEKVKGVFGWPAIHMRKEYTSKGYNPDELWIDCGLESKKDILKKGIEVGNVVTFDTEYEKIGDYHTGRSLDNKIGGYIIAEVLKKLKANDVQLPYDLIVVNSVQEEVGLHGAQIAAKRLQADISLVHDVCHNTNHPKTNHAKDGYVEGGKGPCLEFTAQNHRGIISKIKEVAKDNKINLQHTPGSYGNDTMAFFLENTPTAIISTPLKYMHTTVEMAHKKDVDNAIDLFYLTLLAIDNNWIESITNPKA